MTAEDIIAEHAARIAEHAARIAEHAARIAEHERAYMILLGITRNTFHIAYAGRYSAKEIDAMFEATVRNAVCVARDPRPRDERGQLMDTETEA